MMLLVKLALAHILGDFMLQSRKWVEAKEKKKARAWQFYAHIALHGFLILLLTCDLTLWPLAVGISMSHAIIDLVKLHFQKKENLTHWFIIDQAMHVIAISLLWVWNTGLLKQIETSAIPNNVWIIGTSLLFLTQPTGIIMNQLMSYWNKMLSNESDQSLTDAGKYIGILERLFVFGFILMGALEAIGFLLAAKSVFRFGDLRKSKERKLTEYILIGTLLSFAIAMSIGLLTKYLVTL